jgi:hypothetical protein
MRYKVEIFPMIQECGDGCCSWSWSEAQVHFEDGSKSDLRKICGFSILDDEEGLAVAADFFNLDPALGEVI